MSSLLLVMLVYIPKFAWIFVTNQEVYQVKKFCLKNSYYFLMLSYLLLYNPFILVCSVGSLSNIVAISYKNILQLYAYNKWLLGCCFEISCNTVCNWKCMISQIFQEMERKLCNSQQQVCSPCFLSSSQTV